MDAIESKTILSFFSVWLWYTNGEKAKRENSVKRRIYIKHWPINNL